MIICHQFLEARFYINWLTHQHSYVFIPVNVDLSIAESRRTMAQLVETDDIESVRNELSEVERSLRLSLRHLSSSFSSSSVLSTERDGNLNEEIALQWAAIERLPTAQRLRSSLFDQPDDNEAAGKRKMAIDVTKLSALERHMFIERLIKHIEYDNLRLLQNMRKRMNK